MMAQMMIKLQTGQKMANDRLDEITQKYQTAQRQSIDIVALLNNERQKANDLEQALKESQESE